MPTLLFDDDEADRQLLSDQGTHPVDAASGPARGQLRRDIAKLASGADAAIRNYASDPVQGTIRLAGDLAVGAAAGSPRAVYQAHDFVQDATDFVIGQTAKLLGNEQVEAVVRRNDADRAERIAALRPPDDEPLQGFVSDLSEQLTAAYIGGALARGIGATGFSATGVGSIFAGGVVGKTTSDQLVKEGVDPLTAGLAGLQSAAINAAGAAAPGSLGGKLISRLGSGALLNSGFGIADRVATANLLKQNGYVEQAQSFEALAPEALALDLILGAGFAALDANGRSTDTRFAAQFGRDPSPEELDAAVHQIAIRDAQRSPLGVGLNGIAITAHERALERAIQQAASDEPINVGEFFEPRLRLGEDGPDELLDLAASERDNGRYFEAAALARLAQLRGAPIDTTGPYIEAARSLSREDQQASFDADLQARARDLDRETIAPDFLEIDRVEIDEAIQRVVHALHGDPEFRQIINDLSEQTIDPDDQTLIDLFRIQQRDGRDELLGSARKARDLPFRVQGHAWEARGYEPRDVILNFNDGLPPGESAIILGLDPERSDVRNTIKLQESDIRAYVRAYVEEGGNKLNELADAWSLTPDQIIDFVRNSGIRRAPSIVGHARALIRSGLTDSVKIRKRLLEYADVYRLDLKPSSIRVLISQAKRKVALEAQQRAERRLLGSTRVTENQALDVEKQVDGSGSEDRGSAAADPVGTGNPGGSGAALVERGARIRAAQAEFGTGTSLVDSGYVLPDGSLLKVPPGEHESVRAALDDAAQDNPIGAVLSDGAIRVNSLGATLSTRPTNRQLTKLVATWNTTMGRGTPLVIEVINPDTGSTVAAQRFERVNLEAVDEWVTANVPRADVLGSQRQLDGIGFFSAVEESIANLPAERWGMGWAAVRSSIAKGRGVDGYAGRVKDEIDYLGLDDAFKNSKLRGEELRRAVGEYVGLHKLVLDERFNRFDTGARAAAYQKQQAILDEIDRLKNEIEPELQQLRPQLEEAAKLMRAQKEAARGEYLDSLEAQVRSGALSRGEANRRYEEFSPDVPASTAHRALADRWRAINDRVAPAIGALQRQAREVMQGVVTLAEEAGIRRGPGDLRLPGDDPVFELRLKLPPGTPGADFKSHWSRAPSNDDGVLVSVRGEERIDDAGKRTLFGGEVQSDLAQANRKAKERGEAGIPAPLTSRTSQWTSAAVRAMVFRAARDGFDSVSFPTSETSTLIQGNNSAASHYDTNVRGALEKVAALLGGQVREGGVEYRVEARDWAQVDPSTAERLLKSVFDRLPASVRLRLRTNLAIIKRSESGEFYVSHKRDPRDADASSFPVSHWNYVLRNEAGNNPIVAAYNIWVQGAVIFDEPGAFERMLEVAAEGDTNVSESVRQAFGRASIDSASAYVLDITPQMREQVLRQGFPLFGSQQITGSSTARVATERLKADLGRAFGVKATEVDRLIEQGRLAIFDTVTEAETVLGRSVGNVAGGYLPNSDRAFLIADRVAPDQAYRVVLHEVGVHAGIVGLLGETRWTQLQGVLRGMVPQALIEGTHFRDLVTTLRHAGERNDSLIANEVARLAQQHDLNPEIVQAWAEAEAFAVKGYEAEEALAYLVENAPDLPIVRRLLAQIRQWLWRIFGPDFGPQLTVDDLQELAVAALRRESRLAERNRLAVQVQNSDIAALASAQGAGYEGNDTGEAYEWLRAKAKGLDMSVEARLARAKQMGFDTVTRWYRGGRGSYANFDLRMAGTGAGGGEEIYNGRLWHGEGGVQNEIISILKEMLNGKDLDGQQSGSIQYYVLLQLHSDRIASLVEVGEDIRKYYDFTNESVDRINKILSNKTYSETAIFATTHPDIAGSYTENFSGYADGAHIRSVFVRGNYYRFNAEGKNYSSQIVGLALLRAREQAFDGALIENIYDKGSDNPATQIAVFDPANIRSIHAAFDPDYLGDNNLLASFANAYTPDQRARLGKELESRADGNRHLYIWGLKDQTFALALTGRTDLKETKSDAPVRVSFGELRDGETIDIERQNFGDLIQAEQNIQFVLAGIERDIREHQRASYVFVARDARLERLYAHLAARLILPEGYVLAKRAEVFAIIRADEVARTLGGIDGALDSAIIQTTQPVESRVRTRSEADDLRAAARGDLRLHEQDPQTPDLNAAHEIARDDPELEIPLSEFGSPQPFRAREVMQLLALQRRAGDQLEPAFDVAAACALRNGWGDADKNAPFTLIDHPRVQGLLVSQILVLSGGTPLGLMFWEALFLNGQTDVPSPRIAGEREDYRNYLKKSEIQRNPGFRREEPISNPIPSRSQLERQKASNLALVDTDQPLTDLATEAGEIVGFDGKWLEKLALKESGGDIDAQPIDPETGEPLSSAIGLTQFIESTWIDIMKKYGASHGFHGDLRNEDVQQRALALRTNPIWSLVMAGHLAKDNAQALRNSLGRDATERELYLAHFAGIDGALTLIQADSEELGTTIMSSEAASNPALYYDSEGSPRTIGQIRERLGKSFASVSPENERAG